MSVEVTTENVENNVLFFTLWRWYILVSIFALRSMFENVTQDALEHSLHTDHHISSVTAWICGWINGNLDIDLSHSHNMWLLKILFFSHMCSPYVHLLAALQDWQSIVKIFSRDLLDIMVTCQEKTLRDFAQYFLTFWRRNIYDQLHTFVLSM